MKLKKYFLFSIVILVMSGCATVQKPAFDTQTQQLDFTANSYFIMGVEIDNAFKPKYHPNMHLILHIEEPDASKKAERFNLVVKKKEFLSAKDQPASALFKGALPPGDYVIKGISGMVNKFPLLGSFLLQMDTNISLKQNEVAYLGKLEAQTRERQDGEFRAGPVIPLIDQAVTGYGKTTFDVKIVDDSKSVIDMLKQTYPAISEQEVVVKILSDYDRSVFDKKAKAESDKK